ncbi:DNA ligase [Methyloparacoccus murrellii]
MTGQVSAGQAAGFGNRPAPPPRRARPWPGLRRTILAAGLAMGAASAGEPPALLLANTLRADVRVEDYLVSEKYDGVRGYWTGSRFLTRGGETIPAPAWFTAGWPRQALDGELWAGRGRFARSVSILRPPAGDTAAWREIRYLVFDLPDHPGPFLERYRALTALVAGIGQPWVQAVEQTPVASRAALTARLQEVVRQGGEGLMLHRADAPYRPGRSDDLLKLKPFTDADARVVGHVPGKGRYAGLLGSLEVETPEGVRFRLGSGFSVEERRAPPPIGSWVSYRHDGIHPQSGIPRFARFLRLRDDLAGRQPP